MDHLTVSHKKDKRNRQLERESNLLKDELCAMRHLIHLLDNIKRVSRDCISHLHLMVDAVSDNDGKSMDQLKDDVQELEDELKDWEKKYNVMSSIQLKQSMSLINFKVNRANADDGDSIEVNGNSFEQKSERSTASVIPQELCEISMETYNDDNDDNDMEQLIMNHHNDDDDESPAINCPPNSPPPISVSSSSSRESMSAYNNLNIPMQRQRTNCSGQYACDWSGCGFRTNVRQRLVMHKRVHAGELLFSCDVIGCDYQSNYKGNIKIHKKHRHKDGNDEPSSSAAETSMVITPLVSVSKSQTLDQMNLDQSQSSIVSHEISLNNDISTLPKRRRRRKRFRYSMRGHMTHGLNTPINDGTIFACDVKGCKYRTKWKQCLTAHQLLHAGVKPYKCDYPGCSYSTNFKGNVNVHKRVHRTSTSNEIYKCQANGCDFSTPWKNSFMLHQRNHYDVNGGDSNPDASNSNLDFEASIPFDGDNGHGNVHGEVDGDMNSQELLLSDSHDNSQNGTSDSQHHVQISSSLSLQPQPQMHINQSQVFSNQIQPSNHVYTPQTPYLSIKSEISSFELS